ncbi:MAG: hypothetical protein A2431_03785 [Candidatus Zambryskibacteria bacterium RIFOXYC1_FULL_39_10]|uniref:Uncharacterized protein n=1 Tax=Candidatus Zambryskibacteria bacterium RIFOXYC1_FULL_39_10 TaxID=1802779 RepID=A0A1G2V176_9BACT|nr:MAG: hypothetical protein A2431_03785 [Candidatus Zambryskibacteria bacterium RIFOXYC1_FULL_39_10]OHB16471.1 MAG: hypothetical protein A2605_01490 [Candidatus Zambryskibacteria bacterium RIFOXYD1_FULL_39_35]
MPETDTLLESPEIKEGSLVVFRSPDDSRFSGHPADREWQDIRYRRYGLLKVRIRIGNHVVLVDPRDPIDPDNPGKNDIHFGSTVDPSLSVGHVRQFVVKVY